MAAFGTGGGRCRPLFLSVSPRENWTGCRTGHRHSLMAHLSRFLLLLVILLFPAADRARADDISAAGRSVVRVVVVAFEDGEVADFGHGSGFAIAPNRIITNAHVVAIASQLPEDVVVGVVPSEGSQSFRAHIVAVDPARDLALIELDEGSIPPISLYVGPIEDGSPVAALGFPGNVDLATARSADDYINPLPPTRSAGIFSNLRQINGISTLLHTANIARGHSGGPLLDPCGRVIGVNTLITRNENGDSAFGFAVANRELTAFLRDSRQGFRSVSSECVSMAERLREDEERSEAQDQARRAAAAERERAARERQFALLQESRETRLALAVLLLALSLVAFGAGGIMLFKDRQRPSLILGGLGVLLLIGAVIAFLSRPGLAGPESAEAADAAEPQARLAERNLCTLVAERSRVIQSTTDPVPLNWNETGCVNGRTQYAQAGDTWTRILVPEAEQAVSVLEIRPGSAEYVVSRYLLDSAAMDQVRKLRQQVDVKACTSDSEARTLLTDQLREIEGVLPELPNERLVYSCRAQGEGRAEPSAG